MRVTFNPECHCDASDRRKREKGRKKVGGGRGQRKREEGRKSEQDKTQWLMPVIPTLRRLKQKDHYLSEVSLGYRVDPVSKQKENLECNFKVLA